jgi:hypothetical protein
VAGLKCGVGSLQDDVVSRVSPAALEDLRSEIVQTEW